ncbi:MAG: prepilin-type N-terminal cleavage/methylation domain-containing protein [Gemmatimonadota bacterium]|nr:prepilin-type N-terminal cleavage/methylation domain-containing protein [Gemmatimonadota bacterium]MDQ8174043.1 prepilin-type N-terminal cleavage/methylation domain-containing protein [Gemmatimonadota bacterium]
MIPLRLHPAPPRAPLGFTLVELVMTSTLIGILASIALPKGAQMMDHLRVRQAAHEVWAALSLGRSAAIHRAGYTRVIIDETGGSIHLRHATDTLRRWPVGAAHGVTLRASRDTLTFAPTGLGYGASNTTIVVSRGRRADTLVVSRLGRVRASWQ